MADASRERDAQFKLRLSKNEYQALIGHSDAKGLRPSDVLRLYIRSLDEFANQKGSGDKTKACCHGTIGCLGRGDKHWCQSKTQKKSTR